MQSCHKALSPSGGFESPSTKVKPMVDTSRPREKATSISRQPEKRIQGTSLPKINRNLIRSWTTSRLILSLLPFNFREVRVTDFLNIYRADGFIKTVAAGIKASGQKKHSTKRSLGKSWCSCDIRYFQNPSPGFSGCASWQGRSVLLSERSSKSPI